MVSALGSFSSGPCSSTGRSCSVDLGQDTNLTVPLPPQVYKCVPANLMQWSLTYRSTLTGRRVSSPFAIFSDWRQTECP